MNATQSILTTGEAIYNAYQTWAASGDWKPFLDYLTDDVIVSFPAPPPLGGMKAGKTEVENALQAFSEAGLRVKQIPKQPMVNETSFAVEFVAQDTSKNSSIERSLLVVFDIHNGKVNAVREYSLT